MNATFEKHVYSVLGKTMVDMLHQPALTIGKTVFTRQDLIDKLGCGNFNAASRLTRILKELDITTTSQLAKLDPASLMRKKNVGMVTMYIAMCLLDFDDYNVEQWWGWNQEKDKVVKFSTYKHNLARRSKRHAA